MTKQKQKVLLASQYTGSANSVKSVIKKLKIDDKVEVSVVAHTKTAEDPLRQDSIEFKTLSDYGLESLNYETVGKILDQEQPNLLLTGSSAGTCIEKGLILAARSRGIRSISVLDNPGNYIIRVRNDEANESLGCMPDLHTALDSETLEEMVNAGLPRERLVVTGNPYFDDLRQLRDSFTDHQRIAIRDYFGTEPNQHMIVFVSQPLKEDINDGKSTDWGYNEEIIFNMLNRSLNEIDYQGVLVIKFHPREKYRDITSRLNGTNRFTTLISGKEASKERGYANTYDIRATSLAADLTTGMMSTSLIEACILDRDVLSIQAGLNTEDRLFTNPQGYSVPVYKEEYLTPQLLQIMHDQKFRAFLKEKRKELVAKYDGRATERVVELIYKNL